MRYAARMSVRLPPDWETLLAAAVAHYWKTLKKQGSRTNTGKADTGKRTSVTGGKQMNEFCSLLKSVAMTNGMPEAQIFTSAELELPGYFRPTKRWDMIVVDDDKLVAALEFKSQCGPSFGNNFNNRTEEAVGTANDLWTAYREGAFGKATPAPWLGWVMLLEDCPKSSSRVKVKEPHFSTFPEFKDTSYVDRYQILLRRLVLEKLYSGAAFVTASAKDGPKGKFSEPARDLTMQQLLVGFAGAVATHVARKKLS